MPRLVNVKKDDFFFWDGDLSDFHPIGEVTCMVKEIIRKKKVLPFSGNIFHHVFSFADVELWKNSNLSMLLRGVNFFDLIQ